MTLPKFKWQVSATDTAAFLFIVLAILAGNYEAIFGVDVLIHDDNYRIVYAMRDEIPWYFSNRQPLLPPVMYFFFSLVEVSLPLARLAIVFLFVIPTSFLLFKIYTRHFGVGTASAIFAVVLPTILPGQLMMPHFIDGDYVLYGFLFCICSLFLGLESTKREDFIWPLVAASAICFLFAAGLMEQVVFLCIPFVLIFWIIGRNLKAQVFLSAFYLVVAAAKTYWVLAHPWTTNVPVSPTVEVIFERLTFLFPYTLPFPVKDANYWREFPLLVAPIVCFALTVAAIVLSFLSPNRTHRIFSRKISVSEPTFTSSLFALSWIAFTFSPFLFSSYFGHRYLYISAFGVALLLAVFIDRMPRTAPLSTVRLTLVLLILAFSAYHRTVAIEKHFRGENMTDEQIRHELAGRRFPKNSQIAILGTVYLRTGGHFQWSTGYIKYVTGRLDVDGILPNELRYYDAFEPNEGWSRKMIGLSIDRPLFIYRMNYREGTFEQQKYALRWAESGSVSSYWELLELDQDTGFISVVASGHGLVEYDRSLIEFELDQEDVVWGGKPSDKDMERLLGE